MASDDRALSATRCEAWLLQRLRKAQSEVVDRKRGVVSPSICRKKASLVIRPSSTSEYAIGSVGIRIIKI